MTDGGGEQRQVRVGLSTASVYPGSTADAFELAAALGYDGVEILVTTERLSQNGDAIADLVQRHQIPVLSVHSPCLLITARVWGGDPLVKISRSIELAERLDAGVVVAHPPFVWQRSAAGSFAAAIDELSGRTRVRIAIENMFPIKVAGTLVNSYRPHWDPVPAGYGCYTLDLSHTATSGVDALEMADRMGDGLRHLHLADGSGSAKDEHLVPGRGSQPCAELLTRLAAGAFGGFGGSVVVEVTTRGRSPEERESDLAEALTFARWHLDEPSWTRP